MNDAPPVIPPAVQPETGRWFRQMAQASWVAPLIGLVVNLVLVFGLGGKSVLVSALSALFFMGGGVVLGIVALCGIPRYGRRGILIPALVGIGIPVVLAILALPNLRAAQERARPHGPPEPATHSASAQLLKDDRLRFSMDIPDGFVDFPAGKAAPNVEHCFVRELSDAGGARLVVNVQRLDGIIPVGKSLLRDDAARHAPPGMKLDLIRKNWRGLPVDAIVSETTPPGGARMVVYTVQIPLLPSAIQVNVGGPVSHRAEVERLADTVVGSIEGDTNW